MAVINEFITATQSDAGLRGDLTVGSRASRLREGSRFPVCPQSGQVGHHHEHGQANRAGDQNGGYFHGSCPLG